MELECHDSGISLVIAGIPILLSEDDDMLSIDVASTSSAFLLHNFSGFTTPFRAKVSRCERHNFPKWTKVFSGLPWGDYQLAYKWHVFQNDNNIGLIVDFEGAENYNSIFLSLNEVDRKIQILVDSDDKFVNFDPFIYPVGVLMYVYLVNMLGGVMIHASGVTDNDNGYLFSGLSGIGKSTMAGLWKNKDAEIINDDRLIIMPNENNYKIYNTPMPYYFDTAKDCGLTKIFLLKQSQNNYCKKLPIAQGYTNFMSNCIQHFHSQKLVKKHLDIIGDIVKKVPVYELGFYPDSDIVDFIRNL